MPKRTDLRKILLIGSGPIVIGQACEFDYSGTQACKALREEGYEVVCSNYLRIKKNSAPVEVTHKKEFNFIDMLKSNHIGNLTGIYRCDWIGKTYQKEVGHEDYLMWLKVVKLAGIGYCVQEPLAYYRVSNKSLSSNKFRAMTWQWNIYRKELNFY